MEPKAAVGETGRNVRITCDGRSGWIGGWTGPDTPDGSAHVVYRAERRDVVRCPCGWEHRLVRGEVRSVGLIAPPKEGEP